MLGPIRLIAAFVEHLRTRPDATVMTVSSGLAFAPLKITPSCNASKAAIHMLSESVRLQLADTSVKVVELEPPSVRTALLPGHEDNEHAMPLDEFVTEVVDLIETRPDAKEIQVERVKFLRYGEARGDYDQVVEALNATDPHGTGHEPPFGAERLHANGRKQPPTPCNHRTGAKVSTGGFGNIMEKPVQSRIEVP